jgi:hypothetical protein
MSASNLVGFRFIQTTDPAQDPDWSTAGGPGYQWLNATKNGSSGTGILRERNVSNTDWYIIYAVNLTNGGLLPIQGGSVTGAITGPTGWAVADNPNFASGAKISGQNIATVNYVNQQVNSFNELISAKIAQAISAQTSDFNVNSAIAKTGTATTGNGYFPPTKQGSVPTEGVPNFDPIPLPYYPGGAGQATSSESIWIASPAGTAANLQTATTADQNIAINHIFTQVSERIFNNSWEAYASASRTALVAGGMFWSILAVKS